MKPTVEISIIMPMRNASPWVDACTKSIIKQSFVAWELIIVDDHSTDDSLKKVQDYARNDTRIRWFSNRGKGILPALRTALEKAIGQYITRMDADDVMPPNKLKLFHKASQQNTPAIITGKVRYFSDSQKPVSAGYRSYEEWLNERIDKQDHWSWVYRECVIASANWLVPRSFIDLTAIVYPEDYDMVFDWYSKGRKVVALDQVTHHWREHPERTSRTSIHYQQQAFFRLKLRRFVQLDFKASTPLYLLGNNKKTKLAMGILQNAGIKSLCIDQANISILEGSQDCQILIAVYPSAKERQTIERFLQSKHLEHGKNYWWL